MVSKHVLRWGLLFFFLALFGLHSFSYLTPIAAWLDQEAFAVTFKNIRFSPYLVIKTLLILTIIFWVAIVIARIGEQRIRSLRMKSGHRELLRNSFQILVYFIAVLAGIDILGIDITVLTVFSGAIGIGIGFGLQKITSNFISGLILLFEKSIDAGDLIELTDGTFGNIKYTGARYTLIEAFDGKEIMIPNEDFVTSRVVNWTYSNKTGRIMIPLGVSYGSDLEKAQSLILEAAKEHPRTLVDPEPSCYLREFADSSVNFLLYFWIADVTEGRFQPQSEVMFSIWRKFKQNGIEIPFPQRDVHIKEAITNKITKRKS